MPTAILKRLLLVIGILVSGCAPWKDKPAGSYVTVEPDNRHDTKQARSDYTIARDIMEKYVRGGGCDFDRAEEYLRAALAADVRFGPAHHSLGVLYFWQQKLYLAAWEFEYASRLMPDRYEPLNNLGLVYESAGKFEQAKSFYLLAREKSRNHPEVIANLARASLRSGETIDQMRPVLEDVIATDTRPEWRRWAGELLGLNPPQWQTLPAVSLPSSFEPESSVPPTRDQEPVEELPLIPPPSPDSNPTAQYFDESVLLQ